MLPLFYGLSAWNKDWLNISKTVADTAKVGGGKSHFLCFDNKKQV